MGTEKPTIDFDTMRENCIQIHQEVSEIFNVAKHIGESLELPVKSADELRKHPEMKKWDGMGRFSKELYDNTLLWNKLPEELWITLDGSGKRKHWIKEKAKKELLSCYYHLGGKNLYN